MLSMSPDPFLKTMQVTMITYSWCVRLCVLWLCLRSQMDPWCLLLIVVLTQTALIALPEQPSSTEEQTLTGPA